jgi:TRAP-type C4-dicarboxylate transport system permease small subunit
MRSMRRFLDLLYGICGVLAGISVVGILASVLFQVIARFIDVTFDATEISGFLLAAAIFLGLAYTFHSGAHIRMTSLIHSATGTRKRWIELYCTMLCAVSAVYFAWHTVDMVIDSYSFGDKSPGLMAVPFWIPQMPMAFGVIVLATSFIDEFVAVLRGKEPSFKDVEQIEIEDALKEIGVTPAGASAALGATTAAVRS